jgi:hypothetical protein
MWTSSAALYTRVAGVEAQVVKREQAMRQHVPAAAGSNTRLKPFHLLQHCYCSTEAKQCWLTSIMQETISCISHICALRGPAVALLQITLTIDTCPCLSSRACC